MKTFALTAAVASLVSLVSAHPAAAAATPAPTCTSTLPAPPFRSVAYTSTSTVTHYTDCHGCALSTRFLGVGPVVLTTTKAALTTTVTSCAASSLNSACTLSTNIPLTVSTPTCYGSYVTSTRGINCHGCASYTNIAGRGPVRQCGTSKPAATGTTTVLSCAA